MIASQLHLESLAPVGLSNRSQSLIACYDTRCEPSKRIPQERREILLPDIRVSIAPYWDLWGTHVCPRRGWFGSQRSVPCQLVWQERSLTASQLHLESLAPGWLVQPEPKFDSLL